MKTNTERTRKNVDSTVLFLKGKLTIYSVNTVKEKLDTAFQKYNSITLDLSEIIKIDTAGFQLLIAASDEAARQGIPLSIQKESEDITKIFLQYGQSL